MTPTDYPDRVRALLEAATDGPWWVADRDSVAPIIGCANHRIAVVTGDDDGRPWVSEYDAGPVPLADAALIAEAPTLARAYLAACKEVERLSRVLRVEQGDESAAPKGWHTRSDRTVTVWHRGPWSVYRHRSGVWRVFRAGTSGWTGEHRTALEAMEASDRAAGGAA